MTLETKSLKLSDIFTMADLELKQCKGSNGNPKTKQACAIGAICYYLSNGQITGDQSLSKREPIQYKKFLKLTKYGLLWIPLVFMNDFGNVKFKTLAKICRRFNL